MKKETVIVFFAVRSHHYKYFSKVKESFPGSFLFSRKEWWMPNLRHFPKRKSILEAVNILIAEIEQKHKVTILLPLIKLFLTIRAKVIFCCYIKALTTKKAEAVAVWNGQRYRQKIFITAAESLGIKKIFFENGLLPNHTTIDSKGVNYANSMPRIKENYVPQKAPCPFHKEMIKKIKKEGKAENIPEKFIFVPFQVETDSQILKYSPWVKTMKQLTGILMELEGCLPKGWYFVCKEHPAEREKQDIQEEIKEKNKIFFAPKEVSTMYLINKAQAVITINSTVGIESLLLYKKLIVLGQAFYSIKDITLYAKNIKTLRKAIKKIEKWKPDIERINGFISALKNYQVAGSWKMGEEDHFIDLNKKITRLIKT